MPPHPVKLSMESFVILHLVVSVFVRWSWDGTQGHVHGRKVLYYWAILWGLVINISAKLTLTAMQIIRRWRLSLLRFTGRQQQMEIANLCACLSYQILYRLLMLTLNSSLNTSYISMSGHAPPGQGKQSELTFMPLKSTILITKPTTLFKGNFCYQ